MELRRSELEKAAKKDEARIAQEQRMELLRMAGGIYTGADAEGSEFDEEQTALISSAAVGCLVLVGTS